VHHKCQPFLGNKGKLSHICFTGRKTDNWGLLFVIQARNGAGIRLE